MLYMYLKIFSFQYLMAESVSLTYADITKSGSFNNYEACKHETFISYSPIIKL
jgi:hypothetical protein